MTSNLADIEPPLPCANHSLPLPPTRTTSYDLQQTPRSWPRQTLNPTLNAPASSQDNSEPAFKRLKIANPDTTVTEKTCATLPDFLDTSDATNNKGALLSNTAALPDRTSGDSEQHSASYPVRPGRITQPGGHRQGRALAMERAMTKDVVPTKPYVPDPPSFAPRFYKAGKSP